MVKYILISIFILIVGVAFTQNAPITSFMPKQFNEIVLIKPTGESFDGLNEMEILKDTSEIYVSIIANINSSFIKEFIDVYFIAQIYLKNKGLIHEIEPAYLAITKNQGGFAKVGFIIKDGQNHIIKKNTSYVDITQEQATGSMDRLMSITQLYPHELGHVLIHMLCREDSLNNNTKNVNMHFFSVVTDYSTAFNEGFAEHIENVSRTYEKNDNIKIGIELDLNKIKKSAPYAISGFERDFKFKFRLGFYKASMLSWYQKYEDYKRHEQAQNGEIRYKAKGLNLNNIEDNITFRNSGVQLNKNELRNYVQLNSTEGAISSFFTHLWKSELNEQYLDPSFYQDFVFDSSMVIVNPESLFNPLQNQFIKYIKILHNYITFNNSSKSQLIDFIDGYMQEFPSEAEKVKNIYKTALGIEYSNLLPPSLWVLAKNYNHRLLVFDPFDAITIPIYSFDINAAEIEDFLTIEGFTSEDAKSIVEFRNKNGLFDSWKDLESIPDISKNGLEILINSELDNEYMEEILKDFEPTLSIKALLIKPVKYLCSRAIIYFAFIFFMVYYFLIKYKKYAFKNILFFFIKYLVLWISLVLFGLTIIFIFTNNSILIFTLLVIFYALLAFLFFRKNNEKKYRSIISIGIMYLCILLSII